MAIKKIAVFASGNGSNLQALIDNVHGKSGQIALVVSNKPKAYALTRARKHGISTLTVDVDEPRWDIKTIQLFKAEQIEIIVLAGYMRVLTPRFIDEYTNKIINVHPSLIPSFCGKGYYGIKVHREALEYGVKVSGATVHFVDEGTDTGPIIMQMPVAVCDDDTPESLQEKILDIEHEILCKAVEKVCEDKLIVRGRKVKLLP